MRKNYSITRFFKLNYSIALVLILLSAGRLNSQCSLGTYTGIIAPTGGTAFTSYSNYSPGTYFAFPMLNGGSYAVSTCGASIDTQITGWDPTSTSVIFFNDDNGALCSGSAASYDNYVPNFTGYANIQVSEYFCLPGGSSSIVVYVRQNNNLAITSATTAMCSGQIRGLSATPSSLGSVPGGYGDSGTFTGTGVSGTVFTAPTVTAPTIYTVTYTYGYVSKTQTLMVNPNPTISIGNFNICSGNSVTLNPSGAFTYSYSGGSQVVSPSVTTSYSITGTSVDGCVAVNTVVTTVSVNTSPTVTVNSGSICSGQIFTITPGGANTYTITGGSTTVSPSTTTSYSVTGTATNGCVSTAAAVSTVIVNATPTITANSGSICPGQVFTITPGGAGTYTITGGSSTVSPTTTTDYSVTGTSTAGCVGTNTAVSSVTVNVSPTITVNSGSICAGKVFTMTPGGASSYTFSNGSATIIPSSSTSYSVTGTSAQGCVSSNTAVSSVTVVALPTITASSSASVICQGQTVSVSGSGASTYTWTGGSGGITNGVPFSPTGTATYFASGTGSSGCTSTLLATVIVSVNFNPTITVNSGSICTGKSFTIIPAGASTYTISGGTATVSPLITTAYSVTGTSAQGCVGSNTAVSNVTVNVTPTVSVNSGSICSGNSFTILPAGASTYTISGGTATVTPSITTSYSVTGTSAQGCVSSNTAVSGVTVSASPTITANSGSICSGKSFTIVATGATTYTYSGGSATVSPLINTSYSVTGTSAQGCVSTNTAVSNVTVNSTPTVTVNSGSVCSGNSFTLVPSGASSYTYSGGSAVVAPSVTSSYTVIGTSAQGCVNSNTAISTVSVYTTPTITASNGIICSGGSFVINPSGASTYSISGGSYTVSPTVTTNYSITGTSTAGCAAGNTAVVTVSVQASVSVSIVGSNTACTGQPLNLAANGASSYTWNTGATTSTIAPTLTANTTYSVLGASGTCSNAAVINVTLNTTPTVAVNSGSICSGKSFTIVPTGASTYSYLNGGAVVSPTSSSTYSVLGISAQGCVSNNTAVSNVTVHLTPTITVNTGSICSGNSFTIAPTGANSYTYSGGSPVVSPSVSSAYTVTGQSSQGCAASNTAVSTVTVYTTPTISVNSGSICSGNSFTIAPTGASSYTYSGGSSVVTPASSSSYSITGSSSQGCIASNTAVSSVTVNTTPTITAASGLICSGGVYTISPQGAGTYTVTGGSFTVNPLTTTNYSVSGTSSLGCLSSNTAVVTVSVQSSLTVGISGGNTVCSGAPVNFTANGASSYTWNTGALTNTFSLIPSANTTYTVLGTSGVCSGSAAISITVTANPTVSAISSGSAVCLGGTVTLTASGANTYSWSGGALNGIAFTPSATTIYTVVGTSTLTGCNKSTTIGVTVNALPQVSASITSSVVCSGASVTLSGSGADTYTWTGGVTDNVPFVPLATASYSLAGTSSLTGCSSTNVAVASVTVNSSPVLTVSVTDPVICLGGTTAVNAIGAATYTWTGGITNGTVFSPTISGTYSVVGTSSNLCTGGAAATIIVNPLPQVGITGNSIICLGETWSLTANGASSYSWSSGSTNSVIVISPSVTTSYTLVGTDANNCSNTAVYTQSVSQCTGLLGHSESKPSLLVYPNPNNGHFTIVSHENTTVSIMNELGQVVKTIPLDAGANHAVSIQGLTNGVYFVFSQQDGFRVKQKIVVVN